MHIDGARRTLQITTSTPPQETLPAHRLHYPLSLPCPHAASDHAPDFVLLDPPVDVVNLDASTAALHVATVQRWLEGAVIDLNLCPFAKAVRVKWQVRYVVSRATMDGDVLDHLRAEADLLHASPTVQIDTTLLIVPALTDFLDFHSLTERAESVLAKASYEGELQLASFHLEFVLADAEPDDIANATNHAPLPILHLLREDSIVRAAAAVPDAADIYERNIVTTEKLGPEGWAEMAKKLSKTPPRD